ncbi:MAG: hypothetical protein ACLTDF_05510 [Coprococcus sp.]
MIEGRIAGSVISQDLGFIGKSEMEKRASELEDALGSSVRECLHRRTGES